jgi:hypothetical protein
MKPNPEFLARTAQHLQERFKSRHNIILTRDLRLDLLKQIQTKKSDFCFEMRDRTQIHRVYVGTKHYSVIYDPSIMQMMTVLPPFDHPDFEEFAARVRCDGLTKEHIINCLKTPQERNIEAMQRFRKQKQAEETLEKMNRTKERLELYKAFKRIVRRTSLTNDRTSVIIPAKEQEKETINA